MSIDRLIEAIKTKNNPTVAGLDPKLDYIPAFIQKEAFTRHGCNLKGAAEAVWQFNRRLIDALCDIVPAVKPQSAYYELYGFEGVRVLEQTIRYAKERGLYVIADVKRSDIGSTAEAYAEAYLGETDLGDKRVSAFDADAVTVSPYLGSDGIEPFLGHNKSIFLLVKTSNKSSGDFQDKMIDGKPIYELVADYVLKRGEDFIGENGYSNLGAVVGATYAEQLAELREKLPHTFFLVPGYGAQGGGAKDVAGAFDKKGMGAIINASRSIMCAYKTVKQCREQEFEKAARFEAMRMRDDILSVL